MQPQRIGVQCPACESSGNRRMYPDGAGPDGLDCPFCYAYRFQGYPVGYVPVDAVSLIGEQTGERYYHLIDRQSRISTHERRPAFRVVQAPKRPPSNPIERPKVRTEPMPEQQCGSVRHWKTGEILQRFVTGPVTRQVRYLRAREFMKAYPYIKRDRYRRESFWFAMTITAFIVLAALLTVGIICFIAFDLMHLAIVRTQ